MPRKSSMQHDFARIPSGNVPRSSFNLSFTHKTTFDAGRLVPFHWDYRYPGDVDRCSVDAYLRMSSPLDYPLMDNATVTVHWFAIAIRNIWANFRKFFGEQENPGDSIDYSVPTMNTGSTVVVGSVADYLGLPLGMSTTNNSVSALPFRAYRSVYNYWYRDQNLIDSVTVPVDDGPDSGTESGAYTHPLRRGKRHDYFTSAAPSPQKHDAVSIPLVAGDKAWIHAGGTPGTNYLTAYSDDAAARRFMQEQGGGPLLGFHSTGNSSDDYALYADLSAASASTINELRNAFAIQQFLEREMRGGTRFAEQIWSHFQVEFQDAHYAPVYLGGGTAPVIVTPIANQSGSTGNLGDLSAIASAGLSGAGFTYAYTEPSILLGIICVDADLTYQQGIERKWSYDTRYDFYWPEFASLGEQEILNQEIFVSGTSTDADVFGYQERHAELRHGVNRISSEFRSDHTLSLDSWHLAEDFATLPTLNQDFIESDPPFDRVMQVTDAKHFIADIRVNLKTARPMPLYGVPGLRRL